MNPKKRHLSVFTWGVLLTSLLLAVILQISCSRDPNRMIGSAEDQQITQIIDANNSIPQVTDATAVTSAPPLIGGIVNGIKTGLGSVVDSVHNLLLPPCGVDSARVTKNSGGTIYLRCGGEVVGEFQVPANAIPKDTTITVRSFSLEVLGLAIREYQFSPDGLKFNRSATVKLPASLFADNNGILPTELLWLYLNPLNGKWELNTLVPRAIDGNFYVPVSHFSTYRAATKSGIGISQGGQVKPQTNAK